MDGPREAAAAVFLAAGFFAFGFSAAERDFFLGGATRLPLPLAEFDSARSVTFVFAGPVLDFFATFVPFK